MTDPDSTPPDAGTTVPEGIPNEAETAERAALLASLAPTLAEAAGVHEHDFEMIGMAPDPSKEADLAKKKAAREAQMAGGAGLLAGAAYGIGRGVGAVARYVAGVGQRAPAIRVKRMLDDVGSMHDHALHLGRQAVGYNAQARSLDPDLYSDISAAAAKAGVKENEFLATIMDATHASPEASAFRPRMEKLAGDPALESLRRKMAETYMDIEICARRVTGGMELMKNIKGTHIEAVGNAIQGGVGDKLAGLPSLVAEKPSNEPGGMMQKIKSFGTDFAGMVQNIMQNLLQMLSKAAPAA